MSKHRKSGHTRNPVEALRTISKPTRNKVIAGALAVGALGAVAQPVLAGNEEPRNVSFSQPLEAPVTPTSPEIGAALPTSGISNAPVALLQPQPAPDAKATTQRIDEARIATEAAKRRAEEDRKKAEQAAAETARQQAKEREAAVRKTANEKASAKAGNVNTEGYSKPADGEFTSGFGARWGTSHNGIDIANSIGTPIRAVTGGTVIDAGPASGFGKWVRLQHDDGTITVYGHVSSFNVSEGDRVDAGQQIAEMGNEGQSTGSHLHFEVIEGGEKINPLPWLEERGISVQ